MYVYTHICICKVVEDRLTLGAGYAKGLKRLQRSICKAKVT